MPYTKQTILTGDLITADWGNYIQTQYDAAKADLDAHANAATAHGIDKIKADLERNSYDDYNLHMELYYTGHHGGPAISGLTGMTFDGFQDTLRVNTGVTTAKVDTVRREVYANNTTTTSEVRPSSVVNDPGNTGLSGNRNLSNLNYMIDASTTTYAGLGLRYGDSGTDYVSCVFDLGTPRIVSYLKILAYQSGYNSCYISRVAYSMDNVTWSIYDNSDVSIGTSQQWCQVNIPSTPRARYVAFEITCSHPAADCTLSIYDTQVGVYNYQSSLVQSTTKSLASAITRVDLYLSSFANSGTITPQISLDGGTTWQNLALNSSRSDPMFPSFTEKYYVLNSATAGSSVVLKVTLTPGSDTTLTPIIKRYGLFWS